MMTIWMLLLLLMHSGISTTDSVVVGVVASVSAGATTTASADISAIIIGKIVRENCINRPPRCMVHGALSKQLGKRSQGLSYVHKEQNVYE